MAVTAVFLIICTFTLITCCYSQGPAGGRVNILSVNESVELFCMTDWKVFPVFSANLDINLRPPCPSCHPSYNYVIHDNQFIVPSTEIVTFFTFLPEKPFVYTQVVSTPNCEPLSIYESILSPSLLYLDCKDIENDGNYFLAQLERFPGRSGDNIWIFSTLSGFGSLEQAGTYVGVMAIDLVMMLYVHETQDYIELNGFLTGYIDILTKPSECTNIVRISATGNSGDRLLLECSTSETELVSVIHILDSVTSSTHLLTTSPYEICPIRFSEDGSVAAIFTEFNIIVIDLVSESYTNVTVNQSIYDGVVSQSTSSNTFYLVYSTIGGLHRLQLSLTTTKTKRTIQIWSESLFPNTGSICAREGCPLLYMVNQDLVLAAVDSKVALLSISGLERVAMDIQTQHPPLRFVFQTVNNSVCGLTPSVCSLSSLEVTIVPSLEARIPLQHGNVKEQGNPIKQTTAAAIGVAATIVTLMVTVILTAILLVAARKKKWLYSGGTAFTRYKRSSDRVELISCGLESASGESMDSGMIQLSRCSTDSCIIDDDECATDESKCELLTTTEDVEPSKPNETVTENKETNFAEQKDGGLYRATLEVERDKHNETSMSSCDHLQIHAQEEQHNDAGGKLFVHGYYLSRQHAYL